MNWKMKVLIVASAAVVAFGAMALGACSAQSDEDVIKDLITADLDQVKNIDEAFLDDVISSDDISYLADYGIDGKEFVKSYLEGFDYSIDGIEVDGDSAFVSVTLICKSMSDFSDELASSVEELTSDAERLVNMDEDELNLEIGAAITNALANVQAKPSDSLVLEYQKVNGQWEPTESAEEAVASSMFEGL